MANMYSTQVIWFKEGLCKTWLRMQKKGSISTTKQIASYALSHFSKNRLF